MSTLELSIVIATYRRRSRLQRCLERVREHTRATYELVVVDGGEDGTLEWLATQPHVRPLRESPRRGCCAAYDQGFRAACGEFVMWLNDDAYPLPGAIDSALDFLRRAEPAGVGMAAFYHNHPQPWNELHGVEYAGEHFGVLHVRGFPYANFGMLRRGLMEGLGFLDVGYRFCAWDPDLALKVQFEAGLHVVGAPGALVYHEEHLDPRKLEDVNTTRDADNQRLFQKWALPEKGQFADPRPAYLACLAQCA